MKPSSHPDNRGCISQSLLRSVRIGALLLHLWILVATGNRGFSPPFAYAVVLLRCHLSIEQTPILSGRSMTTPSKPVSRLIPSLLSLVYDYIIPRSALSPHEETLANLSDRCLVHELQSPWSVSEPCSMYSDLLRVRERTPVLICRMLAAPSPFTVWIAPSPIYCFNCVFPLCCVDYSLCPISTLFSVAGVKFY